MNTTPEPTGRKIKDERRNLKVSEKTLARVTEHADKRGVPRDELMETALLYFFDRAECGYVVEYSFVQREMRALGLAVLELAQSNRLRVEGQIADESDAYRVLLVALQRLNTLKKDQQKIQAKE